MFERRYETHKHVNYDDHYTDQFDKARFNKSTHAKLIFTLKTKEQGYKIWFSMQDTHKKT